MKKVKPFLSEKRLVILETGEVLRSDHYSPGSRKPYATYIPRNYRLA